jgi:arsenate reductase
MKSTSTLFPEIEKTIKALKPELISSERKALLHPLSLFMKNRIVSNELLNLNFICTHNSRRSHLSQVWAQTMGHYFDIPVQCYAAGTESTALYPMIAETLEKQGFQIQKLSETLNPVYAIKHAHNDLPTIAFSKTLDNHFNPQSGFAAIMTCDSAAEACPVVSGAAARFPIMYEDPKAFDDTPQQAAKYEERSLQIATEMLYVFSQITK